MSKRLILHVGPHKTGSTYLQKLLRLHAKDLQRHGITYPKQAQRNFGHGAVVSYLRGGSTEVTEETFSQMREADTLLLSSENFVLLSATELQQLRRLLPDHEVQVVFILRSLTSVLPSHWQETVKHGNDNTFLTYLARANRWIDGDLAHVMPSEQLTKFALLFGREALTIISYENAIAGGGDLFDAFVEHALGGVALAKPQERGKVVNPAFPPPRLELIRSLNETHRREVPRGPGPSLRNAYMQWHKDIEGTAEYDAFVQAFRGSSVIVTVSESDPLVQADTAAIHDEFGPRIANPGPENADDQVLSSTTPCSVPNWVDAAGLRGYVDALLADLVAGVPEGTVPVAAPRAEAQVTTEQDSDKGEHMTGAWEDFIALNAADVSEFETLGPASEHRATDTHTDWTPEGPALDAAVERDTYPLPTTGDREGYYGPHHFSYWASGHRDARLLRECCERLGVTLRDYLDFGCASGRVIRHFATAGGVNVTGCDINRRHVDWCAQHLPPTITVFQNHSIPMLPLADDSQDAVSAFSVFTHLEAFDTTWLMELRRILRPGGIAWVTVHNEHTWQEMTPQWPLYKGLQNLPAFGPYLDSRDDLPHDRTIFRWHNDRSYSSTVFYTQAYIRRVWAPIMEIAEEHRRTPGFQDVVVLRKT